VPGCRLAKLRVAVPLAVSSVKLVAPATLDVKLKVSLPPVAVLTIVIEPVGMKWVTVAVATLELRVHSQSPDEISARAELVTLPAVTSAAVIV
jgi:hypothetical protein